MKEYDIVVLGAGPGGYVAAIKAAQMGAKTAIIEKEEIGGVCLNWGCIPTKALLRSAEIYEGIMDSKRFGIDIKDTSVISINWDTMQSRKDRVVKKLTDGVKFLLRKNGVDTYIGYGEIVDKNTIKIKEEEIKTKNLILATGSSPRIASEDGVKSAMDKGYIVTSQGVLSLEEIPKSLIIVGGGVIGVEFATLYKSLGADVTILERGNSILSVLDKDVRNLMEKVLVDKGVEILYNVNIQKYEDNKIIVNVNNENRVFEADKILVCIGRTPNIKGLEPLGLEISRGAVVTNERLETNVPGVYAIGDLNGKYMLAHVASHEGIIAVENIMGHKSEIDYSKIPSCVYGFPEIGTEGMTEEEAKEKGHEVVISSFPLSANGKALAAGETTGFVKIVADEKQGEVLGVHIIGIHATDMIAEAVTTMQLEGTVHDIAKAIHPHPTLSEIVMEAAHGAVDKPIHIYKP